MELRHLRYFLAVADAAHFRRAASNLRISQPTLSQQIRQLELELGTLLFDRFGKRVVLTAAGDTFRAYARRVMCEIADARVALTDLDDLRRGTLSVGVVQSLITYLVPSIVARFADAHPGVFLKIEELTASQVEQEVAHGRLDLGVSFTPTNAGEIDCERLLEDEFVVIVSNKHSLARRRRLTLKELEREGLILLPDSYWIRTLINETAKELGLQLKVMMEINSVEGILASVGKCDWVTILPALTLAKKRAGLKVIPIFETRFRRAVGLHWRRGRSRSRASEAFARCARAVAVAHTLARP